MQRERLASVRQIPLHGLHEALRNRFGVQSEEVCQLTYAH